MHTTSVFSVGLIALVAQLAVADSGEFSMVAIASGSKIQYDTARVANGAIVLGDSTSASPEARAVVTDAGLLRIDNSSYAQLDSSKAWKLTTDPAQATRGFSLKGSRVLIGLNSGFYATPAGPEGEYAVSSASSAGAIQFVFRATDASGYSMPNFAPSEARSNAANKAAPGLGAGALAAAAALLL